MLEKWSVCFIDKHFLPPFTVIKTGPGKTLKLWQHLLTVNQDKESTKTARSKNTNWKRKYERKRA